MSDVALNRRAINDRAHAGVEKGGPDHGDGDSLERQHQHDFAREGTAA